MGCGGSTDTGAAMTTGSQKAMNKSIEDKIQAQKKTESSAVKILLLGAGECGKSTILKQMKIINLKDGFSASEIAEGRELVFKNTVDAIQSIIQACKDLQIGLEGCEEECGKLMKIDTSATIPLECAPWIDKIWQHEGSKTAKKREAEFHLLDSAPYFLDRAIEYFKPDFEPSKQDILRTRLTTTGIIETSFTMDDGMIMKMYDVGGQRGERKKWIHCFDDVKAIMYIASLAEFNQVLAEDRNRNRLTESLDLFEGIANLPWFEKAAMFLFLNKLDLYEEKVVKVDIGEYHPDFREDGYTPFDVKSGIDFITNEYSLRVGLDYDEETGAMVGDPDNPGKSLYLHVSNATDTSNIAKIWGSCKHMILESKMAESGLNFS